MAIAFDAFASSTEGTGNLTFTLTPVGTARGVLVPISVGTQDDVADQVTGVTAGGIALSRQAFVEATPGEAVQSYAYFLGSGIPAGPLTIVVTVSGSTSKRAAAYSVTASTNTEVENVATLVTTSVLIDDPSVVLATGAGVECFCAGVFTSGLENVTSIAPASGYTEDLDHEYGPSLTASWIRRTANSTGGNVTLGWVTDSANDVAAIGIALREVASGNVVVGPVIASAAGSTAGTIVGGTTGTLYYASPTGSSVNNGLTTATPFRPADFFALPPQPGDTLNLMDGTYQGASHMLTPPSGLSGTSGNPTTIRALNDGAVTIDGQGVRSPISLVNNRWLVIEGLDASNGACTVVETDGGSTDNIIRRVVAWDAANADSCHVVRIAGQRNLLEDVGAFGTGASTYRFGGDAIGTATNNTCRRCWGRHERSTNVLNTKETVYLHYPPATDHTLENAVMTWHGEPTGDITSVLHIGAGTASAGLSRVLGTIAYIKCDATNVPLTIIDNQGGGAQNQLVQDTIAVIQNGCWTTSQQTFLLRGGSPTLTKTATRVSSWGGAGEIYGPHINSEWTITDFNHSSTFPGTNPNPWTGANGAVVCKRYVNGVLTNGPLWPWPMNQRIVNATAVAPNSATHDVTAEIEALLGAIPSQCRADAVTVVSAVASAVASTARGAVIAGSIVALVAPASAATAAVAGPIVTISGSIVVTATPASASGSTVVGGIVIVGESVTVAGRIAGARTSTVGVIATTVEAEVRERTERSGANRGAYLTITLTRK